MTALPTRKLLTFGTLALTLAACEGSTGSLSVLVESEDVILKGIEAGESGATIRDGWSVRFEKYIAVLGDLELELATDDDTEAEAHEIYAVDLTQIPATGLELWKLDNLAEGRWTFNYSLSGGGHGALRHETVSEADFELIRAGDLSYLIEGTIEKADGLSCPPKKHVKPGDREPVSTSEAGDDCYENASVDFLIPIQAETEYGPCSIDGLSGVVVSSGSVQSTTITIHGDHIFFNGFPTGSEGGVRRYAQWLADADLDLDGRVTEEELKKIAPSDLPMLDQFQLGGSPISPLNTVWDYVKAQLKTQGHYQGEGECPVDGTEHDHDHDHDDEDHDDHDH